MAVKVFMFPKRLLLLTALAAGMLCRVYAQETDFLYWRLADHRRESDGGVTAVFALQGGEGAEKIEIYYTSIPVKTLAEKSPPEETIEMDVFYRELAPMEKSVGIYSDHYEAIELWARARRNGKTMVAQTRMSLFGESKPREGDFKRIDALPNLPGVFVSRLIDTANPDSESIEQLGVDREHARSYSTMQTGETALLCLIQDGKIAQGINTMRIYEGVELSAKLSSTNSLFTFSIPGYRDMADSNIYIPKNIVAVFESDDGIVSCYIPVYRALYGYMNLSAGLAILLPVLALSAAAICFKGRKAMLSMNRRVSV
jgi:hypothetical protein